MLAFEQLFVGGTQAYGRYQVSPKKVATVTERTPASVYKEHLAGGMGLGLVPIRLDGTCRFAAIDIDDHNVDHAALYVEVTRRKMPLSVCRSKSGGAHLYLFIKEPGIPALRVITLLKKWAALLSHRGVEIFPKQKQVDEKNTGNWINLPYHDSNATTRYAIGSKGALTLAEFLASIIWYDEVMATSINEGAADPIKPPCLRAIETAGGLTEGGRNNGLYNYAVFFRKAYPQDWAERVTEQNKKLKAPLSINELGQIIKSLNRGKAYQYRCSEAPIEEFCQRPECEKLEFGVGHMPWDEEDYDVVSISQLRKYLTDPPYYMLEVNGMDLKLTSEELHTHTAFRKRIREMLNIVAQPRKLKSWDMEIKKLLLDRKEIPLPLETSSVSAQVIDLMQEFLILRHGAKSWDDILRNLPYEAEEVTWFKPLALLGHLQHRRLRITSQELATILHGHGLYTKKWKIKGREIELWGLPAKQIIEQTEAFTPPVIDDESPKDAF